MCEHIQLSQDHFWNCCSFSWNYFVILSKIDHNYKKFMSRLSIVFHWYMSFFMQLLHSFAVSFKVWKSSIFLLIKTILAILHLLCFCMDFSNSLSFSAKRKKGAGWDFDRDFAEFVSWFRVCHHHFLHGLSNALATDLFTSILALQICSPYGTKVIKEKQT